MGGPAKRRRPQDPRRKRAMCPAPTLIGTGIVRSCPGATTLISSTLILGSRTMATSTLVTLTPVGLSAKRAFAPEKLSAERFRKESNGLRHIRDAKAASGLHSGKLRCPFRAFLQSLSYQSF